MFKTLGYIFADVFGGARNFVCLTLAPTLLVGSIRLAPKAFSYTSSSTTSSVVETYEDGSTALVNTSPVFSVPVEAFASGNPWTCYVRDGGTCLTWYHQTTKEFYSCIVPKAGDSHAICTRVANPLP
jgi:hypothetical protein